MHINEQNDEHIMKLDSSIFNEMTFALLPNMDDSLIVTDHNNRIIYLNPRAIELIGTSLREAKDKKLRDLVRFQNAKTKEELCNASVEDELNRLGKISCHNMILHQNSRSSKYISLSVLPLSNNGKMFLLKDRTEIRNLEQELTNPAEYESIKLFMAGVVHDFNSMLTCILGYVSLVGRKMESFDVDDNKIVEWLQNSERGCHNAKELANKLMSYSKSGTVNKTDCSLKNIIEQTSGFICSRSNIECNIHFPKKPFPVKIDSTQISRVFNNLLINAVQSMPTGGQISIDVENCRLNKKSKVPIGEGKYIKISISDTGYGIDKRFQNKMFRSYFSHKNKGNGIGLLTCKKIIEDHNGHITFESNKGQGTTFYIYLPAENNNSPSNHFDSWNEA